MVRRLNEIESHRIRLKSEFEVKTEEIQTNKQEAVNLKKVIEELK